MSATTDSILSRILPSADSPNWPLLAVVVVAFLALGPRALDSWRRYKYSNKPGIERRSPSQCEMHSDDIKRIKAEIEDQASIINCNREDVAKQIAELRSFIDDRLDRFYESVQRDRLAFEGRIARQYSDLIGLIGQLSKT